MKRIATAVAVAGLLTGCAHTDEWSRQDTVMQSLVTASYVIDAVQTSRIQDDPYKYEDGFAKHFLGTQPSTSDTWMYFGTITVSSYLIARALPSKWRPYWQGGQLAIQTPVIISNMD